MDFLPLGDKIRVFRRGVQYGVLANSLHSSLHSLVSAVLRIPIWWTQNDSLKFGAGITGGVAGDDGIGVQITTARTSLDPVAVSFVYCHEVGHVVLNHYASEEGSILYGFYTKREAEATAFAFAYLYVTKECRIPSGGRTNCGAICAAVRRVYTCDRGFYWSNSSRIRDIELVRRLWDEQNGRFPGDQMPQ